MVEANYYIYYNTLALNNIQVFYFKQFVQILLVTNNEVIGGLTCVNSLIYGGYYLQYGL